MHEVQKLCSRPQLLQREFSKLSTRTLGTSTPTSLVTSEELFHGSQLDKIQQTNLLAHKFRTTSVRSQRRRLTIASLIISVSITTSHSGTEVLIPDRYSAVATCYLQSFRGSGPLGQPRPDEFIQLERQIYLGDGLLNSAS